MRELRAKSDERILLIGFLRTKSLAFAFALTFENVGKFFLVNPRVGRRYLISNNITLLLFDNNNNNKVYGSTCIYQSPLDRDLIYGCYQVEESPVV